MHVAARRGKTDLVLRRRTRRCNQRGQMRGLFTLISHTRPAYAACFVRTHTDTYADRHTHTHIHTVFSSEGGHLSDLLWDTAISLTDKELKAVPSNTQMVCCRWPAFVPADPVRSVFFSSTPEPASKGHTISLIHGLS